MRKVIFIILFALLGIFSAQAYFKVDGIYYNYRDVYNSNTEEWERIDGEVEVSRTYDASYSGSVVIPSTVEYNGSSYRVTSIGWGAFQNCKSLTSVTIPESVTYIEDYAV